MWQITSRVPGYHISTVEMPKEVLGTLKYRYETMVFTLEDGEPDYMDLACERSQTEEEAVAAHTKLLGEYSYQPGSLTMEMTANHLRTSNREWEEETCPHCGAVTNL